MMTVLKTKPITNWNQVALFMTCADVAWVLNCSNETARRMCSDGTLPAVKVGGQWRVEKNKFKAWLGVGE